MRALRVVGLSGDGKSVICEDPRGERFTLPADERLRAAARGDITRLGQIEIELESQMRPREIQSRIRAGDSVEQVANAAGLPAQRVERFAYPVLLERSRTAELAQQAHPVREDGPDVQTLGEVVAHAFGLRGQDYGSARWDSWRGEDGKWIVALHWKAGRSDNRARWVFSPGAHGGTVTALDDAALELLDPNFNAGLRTVHGSGEPAARRREEPEILAKEDPVKDAPVKDADDNTAELPGLLDRTEPVGQVIEASIPDASAEAETAEPAPTEDEAAGAEQAKPAAQPAARKGKNKKAMVPSWEDVLLGVKSQRG
ncbi:DUF3071 family protein [Tamaricihabitans halophyticus]|uniref:DUF3071 family protein n=1 Tax=Tamaricihabitans halophyticus TaxID=1262583 RepID=A0A4R2RA27_9PSEU|nr:septation protein SepH [Tamaricihabitans halophyticus]TCP56541.1 DUF3071 family protein [Tamaricihabitans halophyticus]